MYLRFCRSAHDPNGASFYLLGTLSVDNSRAIVEMVIAQLEPVDQSVAGGVLGTVVNGWC